MTEEEKRKPGRVYLVGAGPGDEGLITVKGAGLLKSCDCIIYDHLASEKLLDYAREGCEKIFAGKQKGFHSKNQEEIQELLVQKATEGRTIVRLKGGDPLIFGRGGEEALALKQAGIPYEIIPGVTSAAAVPAAAGIPLTHRNLSQSFHVITGHKGRGEGLPEDFYRLGCCGGTLVFLMGMSRLEEICKGLIGQGWDKSTPAAVIQNGTLPEQKIVTGTLEDIKEKAEEAGIGTPAVIVVGETAGLGLLSDKKRSLEGVKIGIVGTGQFLSRMEGLLASRGAFVSTVCRLRVRIIESREWEESIARLSEYTWLIFTSANGVRLFFERLLRDKGMDLRCLAGVRIGAIGPGTGKALSEYYLQPDYMPEQYDSQSLARGLLGRLKQDDKVLIPRAKQGSRKMAELFGQAGISFQDLPIYDVEPEETGKWKEEEFDFLVFGSGSGIKAFFCRFPKVGRTKLCCLGEASAKALAAWGYQADCIARRASAEGMTERIEEELRKN